MRYLLILLLVVGCDSPTESEDCTNIADLTIECNDSEECHFTFSIGFMIVENSEIVILNAEIELVKGVDYNIDYSSGTISFISELATQDGALITVTYCSNEVFNPND